MRNLTACFLLGFHVQSEVRLPDGRILHWDDLVLGPQLEGGSRDLTKGRASYGILQAFEMGVDAVFFSTGASMTADGVVEAHYTYRRILDLAEQFAEILNTDAEGFRAWLVDKAQFDIKSKTTGEELNRNLSWSANHGYKQVTIVTNAFHVPRALALALQTKRELGLRGLNVFATAPEDGTEDGSTQFEIPSRPGPNVPWFLGLRKIFALPIEVQATLFPEVMEAIGRFASSSRSTP